ncbi:MAG: 5'-nucleotidase C-terminal domain-containing protein [Anaerolineae bacterium]|nr:5'-nucleotidase C-terminal domain-containing protein [Anaerolineae bacterium]NUQ04469.1 5'-nucleotidase C-terminal domain-containing protein [Anaerolineae bacterium]
MKARLSLGHLRLSFLLLVLAAASTLFAQQDDSFHLTVMHTNDTRANHLPDAEGVGGAARLAAVVREIRQEADNTLLLDAGGRFTGTLFHRVYAGQDNAQMMNALGYDAMTVGNPEFDNGDVILAQFIDALNFPVLAANIDASRSDALADKFLSSTVLDVGGTPVGIIGITTDTTPRFSSPGRDLIFAGNYTTILQEEADALSDAGADVVIVLSYLGYDADVEIAPALTGVDLIVGGNTRTLLSNTAPDAVSAYPTVMEAADGRPLLIVQSGGGARGELRYMGRIDLAFDDAGVLTEWQGDTILLSADITPDPDVEALVDDLNAQVEVERRRVIRSTGGAPVEVIGSYSVDGCRVYECELGNLVADALRWRTGADIALMNGGGMRGGLAEGVLERGDVLEFLPFTNRLTTFDIRGEDLILALENGVSRVNETSGTGRFPQVSGMRYTYDLSLPVRSRIVSAETLGRDGETYTPVDPDAFYTVVTNDFMRKGGDGYQVFADRGIDPADTVVFFDDVFIEYAREHSPLQPLLEGRITVLNAP